MSLKKRATKSITLALVGVRALLGSLSSAYSLWDSVVERREADGCFTLL